VNRSIPGSRLAKNKKDKRIPLFQELHGCRPELMLTDGWLFHDPACPL
jgi:hypothetical protein